MIISDKTSIFKDVFRKYGSGRGYDYLAMQRELDYALRQAMLKGGLIINELTVFGPPRAPRGAAKTRQAIIPIYLAMQRLLAAKGRAKAVTVVNHKTRRIHDILPLASEITLSTSADPRYLALWLKNPDMRIHAKLGKKFAFNYTWAEVAKLRRVDMASRAELVKFITLIVALTPMQKEGPIPRLGAKKFDELVRGLISPELALSARTLKLRLAAASRYLQSSVAARTAPAKAPTLL